MTAKKRWVSKQCESSTYESEDETKTNISWSNSSSSDTELPQRIKPVTKNPWIKLLPKPTNVDNNDPLLNSQSSSSSTTTMLLDDCLILGDSPINRSPEIKSPILIRKHRTTTQCSQILKLKQRRRSKSIDDCPSSPELFSSTQSTSYSSRTFIEGESPVNTQSSLITNDYCDSPISGVSIDLVDTQHASDCCADTVPIATTSALSRAQSDLTLMLYHQPPKKRPKKGGLASRLDRALIAQKTSLGIWHHELFIDNLNKRSSPVNKNDNGDEEKISTATAATKVIRFSVKTSWKEYSCTALECVEEQNDVNLFDDDDESIFLLIISSDFVPENLPNGSFLHNIAGLSYKMLPPYSSTTVTYKTKETRCYFNASRFVSIE